MNREVIVGTKLETLQENGRIPKDLKWVGEIPPSYSISIIRKPDKTVIALVDSFAGGVSYAVTKETVSAKGKDVEIDNEEIGFLKRRYAGFLNVIR